MEIRGNFLNFNLIKVDYNNTNIIKYENMPLTLLYNYLCYIY